MVNYTKSDVIVSHYGEDTIHRCAKLLNTEIDSYNVYLVGKKNYRHEIGVFKPIKNKCISDSYKVVLIKKYLKLNNIINMGNVIDKIGLIIGGLPGTTYEKAHCPKIIEQEDGFDSFSNCYGGNDKYYTEIYEIVKVEGKYDLRLIERTEGISDNNDTGKNVILIEERNYDYIRDFLISLLITIIIETTILYLTAKFCRKSRSIKTLKLIITGILASTVTLPLLWFVLPIFFNNYWLYVIFGEILVTAIEVFIIKYLLKVERKMAIFVSIVCNLCSFIVGLFIF